MTHDRARELLLDLAYGELAPDEAREVEAHLASCPGCAAERDRLASLRALAARAAPLEPSGRGRAALLAAAREAGRRQAVEARRERSPFAAFLRPALWTAAATVTLVGIVIGATLKLAGPATERDRLAPESWSAPATSSAVPPATETSPAPPLTAPPPPARAPEVRPAPAAPSRSTGTKSAQPSPSAPPAPSAPREERRSEGADAASGRAEGLAAEARPEAAPAPAASSRRSAAAPAAPAAAPVATPSTRAPASPVVEEIERRRAAGELSELRRRPGGCVEDRRGFVDSPRSRILLVVERRAGGLVLSRWYDDDGRLRAVASGGWSAALDPDGAVSREEGAVEPVTRAIALEARDPSDALFGAARGCPATPTVP
jgi:hypothetical protein